MRNLRIPSNGANREQAAQAAHDGSGRPVARREREHAGPVRRPGHRDAGRRAAERPQAMGPGRAAPSAQGATRARRHLSDPEHRPWRAPRMAWLLVVMYVVASSSNSVARSPSPVTCRFATSGCKRRRLRRSTPSRSAMSRVSGVPVWNRAALVDRLNNGWRTSNGSMSASTPGSLRTAKRQRGRPPTRRRPEPPPPRSKSPSPRSSVFVSSSARGTASDARLPGSCRSA